MNLSSVLKRIPYWYASQKCVYIKSAPGRGKTTVFVDASSILSKMLNKNIGHVVINGPLLTPADSIGYLVPKTRKDERGIEHLESQYTDPFWFRTSEGKRLDEYDGGIIIVDEADKMDADTKKVIGEAALSRRLGPHVLPNGWVVWMAGNRSQDRSGSTKELDHLINRRIEIDVTDDLASWNEWAAVNNVSPITMAFANQNPHIVWSEKVPEKQGPWCTPRSLVEMDRHLQMIAKMNNDPGFPDDLYTMEEAQGMIGAGAVSQYFAFVRLDREMPKFETIIAKPMEVRIPEKPDAQMLVCYNLAHRVSYDTAEPVIKYVDRMPKEFAVTFAQTACRRDYSLLRHPAVNSWSMRNSSLMAAIALNK
jgi:hypothetical protein